MERRLGAAVQVICAAMAAILLAAQPADAQRSLKTYSFTVKWSVFPELVLARGKVRLEDRGSSYRMSMSARVRVALPSIRWDANFTTTGRRSRGVRRPQRFERSSTSSTRRDRAVITWRRGAPPRSRIQTQPPQPARRGVKPSEVGSNSIDPLTYVAQVYDKVIETNGASCDVTAKTWDGVRLAEIKSVTGEKLRAQRIDCEIKYLSIKGIADAAAFQGREISTQRVVRFEKKLGVWQPVWVRIKGKFGGFNSSFTTELTPLR